MSNAQASLAAAAEPARRVRASGCLLASRPERAGLSFGVAGSVAAVLHLLLLVLLLRVPPAPDRAPLLREAGETEQATPIVFAPPHLERRLASVPLERLPGPGDVARSARPRAAVLSPAKQRDVFQPGARARVDAGGPREPEPPLTLGDRLRPHGWDPRLWEAIAPAPLREPARLDGRAPASSSSSGAPDSAAVVAEAHRLASLRPPPPKPPKRWGVAGGRLHLAGISIPIPRPAPWGTSADRISADDRKADMRHTFDERVKAIRERKDREHAEKKSGTDR